MNPATGATRQGIATPSLHVMSMNKYETRRKLVVLPPRPPSGVEAAGARSARSAGDALDPRLAPDALHAPTARVALVLHDTPCQSGGTRKETKMALDQARA